MKRTKMRSDIRSYASSLFLLILLAALGVSCGQGSSFYQTSEASSSLAVNVSQLEQELREGLCQFLKERIPDTASTIATVQSLTKGVSRPPTGEENRVDDLVLTDNNDGTYTLTWTYLNVGDYNQDGSVNIYDISPLAEHFGEQNENDSWPHPTDQVIDGNGDGKIDVSDITPLAENFFTQVVGYKIEGSAEQGGQFVELDESPVLFSEGIIRNGRITFSVLLASDASALNFFRVLPFDENGNIGEASNIAQKSYEPPSPEKKPPVAVLSAAPGWGQAPLPVVLDGSESFDPDGEIVLYEWDFDGDSNFEQSTGTTATVSHTFEAPGTIRVDMKVTDNDGLSSVASTYIIVISSLFHAVSGRVSQEYGYPLPGVTLTLVPGDFQATTDANGEFVINGVINGQYVLIPSRDNWVFEPATVAISITDADSLGNEFVGNWVGGGSSGDWSMFGRDNRNTGRTNHAGTSGSDNLYPIVSASSNAVVGNDGIIYFCFSDKLVAMKPYGTILWEAYIGKGDGSVQATPAVGSDGTIYASSTSGYVFAFYPDGTLKWKFDKPDDGLSNPTVADDGSIYIGSPEGVLYALDRHGQLKWTFQTGAHIGTTPAIGPDGTVYVGSDDFSLYAVAEDGSLKWSYETAGKITSSPAVAETGTIYFGSEDGFLYALNPDGSLLWKFQTQAVIRYSSPSILSDGSVIIGSWDGNVYAINPDGSEKWRYFRGSYFASKPAIDMYDRIYIGFFHPLYPQEEGIIMLSSNGSLLWSHVLSAGFSGGAKPNRKDASIGEDGTLYWFAQGILFAFP